MSKIGTRLFFIMLFLSLTGLIVVSLLINQSIGQYFKDYLYLEEREKVLELVKIIEDSYELNKDFNFAIGIMANFSKINMISLRLEDLSENIIYSTMMQKGLGKRYFYTKEETEKFDIKNNGITVAVLYWYKPHRQVSFVGLSEYFINRVNQAILITAAIISVITIFFSLLFSRYLTGPLIKMNKVINKVAEGDFNQHIEISGDNELTELALAFNEMTAKLRHLEKIRKESTSDLIHELVTPLATLKSYLEAIDDGVIILNNDVIQDLNEELDRLVRLVKRLRELAEVEKKMVELKKEKIDIVSLLNDVITSFLPLAKKKDIIIKKDLPIDKIIIFADFDSIKTIFNNLLSNAVKYTLPDGKIEVQLINDKSKVIIKIKDNGIGILKEDIPYIFERFYRTDKSRSTKTGGTGIGLTITKELVKAHGGEIEVESSVEGTIFTAFFPKAN